MTSSRWLVVAAFFAVLAAALFGVLFASNSAAAEATEGEIVGKHFKPAGTFTQIPAGIERQSWSSVQIPMAEAHIFEIRVAGLDQSLFYALNTVASQGFEVGQRVRVVYRKRGIPFAAKKYLVLEMEHAGAR
jgi:hypothetical protein